MPVTDLVICPRCGIAFEKKNVERHLTTCTGRHGTEDSVEVKSSGA